MSTLSTSRQPLSSRSVPVLVSGATHGKIPTLCQTDNVMTPERMRQYGKGLGLWQDKSLAAGEPISYLKKDDPGRVELIETAKGFWVDSSEDCQAPVNPLANGVFVWTEVKGAGHTFVSAHEDNSPFVYTYGRFGRVGNPLGAVGDGILNFLQYEDARGYYREELYKFGARAFRIDDADPFIIRQYFEKLWSSGVPAVQTPKMGDRTRRNGRTIDQYDVTGKNCTTHTTDGIKMGGSAVFKLEATLGELAIQFDEDEDFAIPASLQRYLIRKSSDPASMQVIEMTAEFRKQYPNAERYTPVPDSNSPDKVVAETLSAIGEGSPYSAGTVGGVLGGVYADK